MKTRAIKTLLVLMCLGILAAITLMPLYQSQYWPLNHEGNTFFLRTQIYAEHMKQGDFLPIYSSADNYGMGSPQPLLYHKLFYFVSGAIFTISDNLKTSVASSIWFFALLGGAGMYFLCRSVDLDRLSSMGGGAIFIVSNYTITNWLVRGAMAEFSAAMLVPIAVASYVMSLNPPKKEARFGFLLGVSVAMMFIAHSVLAYYLVLFMFFAALAVLLIYRNFKPSFIKTFTVAITAFLFLAGPFVVLMNIFSTEYNVGRIIPDGYLPKNQIKPFIQYFFDSSWIWGDTWNSYTVQIDLFVLAALLIGLFARTGYIFRNLRSISGGTISKYFSLPVTLATFILLMGLALQTRWAIPFYEYFPGAQYIQFPWRILAVITPILIALALVSISKFRYKNQLVFSVVAGSIAISGFWPNINYDSFRPNGDLNGLVLSAFGEYVPSAAPAQGYNTVKLIQDAEVLGCHLEEPNGFSENTKSSLVTSVSYRCISSAVIPLPIYATSHHRLVINQGDPNSPSEILRAQPVIKCIAIQEYPGLCGVRLEQGINTIQIYHPTIYRVIKNSYYDVLEFLHGLERN